MRHADLDDALIRRMVEADAARTIFEANRSLRRDSSIEARRFGSAIALRDPKAPQLGFLNRVVGFSIDDLDRIEEVAAFYTTSGSPCQLDLTPNLATPELLGALRSRRFAFAGMMTILHAVPERMSSSTPGVAIARVKSDNVDVAIDLLYHDFAFDPEQRERKRGLYVDNDLFEVFVATIDGEPAAVVSIFFHEGAAHLANAKTIPAKRRRGCQSALVAHAIGRVADRGCTLVLTDVRYATSSHRNVERLGLRIAYQTSWWVRALEEAR